MECEITFRDVKRILDDAMEAWREHHAREPDLVGIHGASFSWATREDLLAAEAVEFRLIDPALIGKPGKGRETNLIIALSTEDGVDGFGQMPFGGPVISDESIQALVDWIEGGAP